MPIGPRPHSRRLPLKAFSKQRLRVGWLIDGRGGPVLKDQLVTLDRGLIESIEPFCRSFFPGEDIVDLTRSTILPALMDAHVHLAFSGTLEESRRREQLRQSGRQARRSIEHHLQDYLHSGVIALRDGGDRLGQALRVRTAHEAPPHLAATCWAWHAPGRYGGMIGQTPLPGESLAQALNRCPSGMDHIKLILSGINSLDRFGHQTRPQFSQSDLAQVRQWATERGLPIMAHANGLAAVRAALDAGCDSIEHGYFMGPDNMHRMADRQVFWVPTAVPMAALTRGRAVSQAQADIARRTLEHQLSQIISAHRSGVPIVLGTDAGSLGVDHGAAVRQELALFMKAGLSLTQAVQCATSNTAQLMGLRNRGLLQPGWRADLIVVQGDPGSLIDRLGNIAAMCIQGDWSFK